MNQKVSKIIRKLSGFKVYRPRKYFIKEEKAKDRFNSDYMKYRGRVVDQKREIYQLAKKVYKKTRDLKHVAFVISQDRKQMSGV